MTRQHSHPPVTRDTTLYSMRDSRVSKSKSDTKYLTHLNLILLFKKNDHLLQQSFRTLRGRT